MRRPARARPYFYPFAVAAYFPLYVASQNGSEFFLRELLAVMAVLFAVTAAVYGIAWLAARGRARPRNVALVTTAIVAWLTLSNVLFHAVHLDWLRLAIKWGVAAALGVLTYRLLRSTREHVVASRLVATWAYLLLGVAGVRTAATKLRDAEVIASSRVVRELASPIPAAGGQSSPDVYVLILDNHSNGCVLAERAGLLNGAFEDSLRALGFVVPRRTRSNYPFTAQSLSSFLSMEHVYPLEADVGPSAGASRAVYYYLAQHGRLMRFLREHGYRVYFVPSLGHFGSRRNAYADVVLEPRSSSPVADAVARSALASIVWNVSVPAHVLVRFGRGLPVVPLSLDTFAAVRRAIGAPGPKLVFAHSLLAHDPIVVTASCEPRRRLGSSASPRAYAQSVRCVDAQVLSLVTAILRESTRPPIIVLQADHGGNTLHPPASGAAERVTAAQAAERFGAFAAYYVPPGVPVEIADTTTAVNALRAILRAYFGAQLPPVRDESYYVTAAVPYHFARITPTVFADPPGACAGGVRAAAAAAAGGTAAVVATRHDSSAAVAVP